MNAEFAKIPEARVFALAPPAIPGISAAGGFSLFLQDRSGGSVEFLAAERAALRRCRPQTPRTANVIPNFSPSVPQIFAEVDKEKVMKQGIPIADVYADPAGLSGRRLRQRLQPLLAPVEGVRAGGRRDARRNPDESQGLLRAQRKGEMVPLSTLVNVRTTAGPNTPCASISIVRRRSSAPRPRLQLGRGIAALEKVAAEPFRPRWATPGRGFRTRREGLSGRHGAVFGLSLVFVFLILAALYESWTLPFSVLLEHAGGGAGRLSRPAVAPFRQQCLRADRARHAGRSHGEERHPDRRVRQRATQAGPPVGGRRAGGRALASAADSDDVVRVHLRLPAAVDRGGAGAAARRMLGTTVVAGMSAATLLGIFFVPALFVFIERIGGHKDVHGEHASPAIIPVAPMSAPEVVSDSGAVASDQARLLGGD